MDVFNIVQAIVVAQSAIFSIVLFSKHKERKSNLFFGFLLLTITLNFTYNFLLSSGNAPSSLINISASYGFLYGPFAFLYTLSALVKDYKFSLKSCLHFIPFGLVIFFALVQISIFPFAALMVFVSMTSYAILGLRTIFNYENATKNVLSERGKTELKWMKFLFYSMGFIILTNIIQIFLLPELTLFGNSIRTELFVQLAILLLVNVVTIQGLSNPHLFSPLEKETFQAAKSKTTQALYSNDVLKMVAQKASTFLISNEEFTNSEVSLNSVATEIDVHPKALSQALNIIEEKSFPDFINHLRVEYVANRLANPIDGKETIVEVMYDAGFSSRSVFNTTFKKLKGSTPSEYKKQLKAK